MSEFRYYRPSAFPPVVKNLLIINTLVFFAQVVLGARYPEINNLFALHDIHSVYFKPYQVLTYMFMHGSFEHLFFNMFALWMFGALLENNWGPYRFLFFYIATGVGAAIAHLIVLYFEMEPVMQYFKTLPAAQQMDLLYSDRFVVNTITVGASGAVFGCLAAFGYLFPNTPLYLYFLFPIKAKWFVILYAGLELWLAIRNSAGDTVAHFAHLGGALVGFIIVFIWNKTNRKTFY